MHESTKKPGADRGSLESHSLEILALFKQGKSYRKISEWLALPPRDLTISRQAVHQWVRARLKKMNSRVELMGAAAAFTSAEVRSPHLGDDKASQQQRPAVLTSIPVEADSKCLLEVAPTSSAGELDPRNGSRFNERLVLAPAPMPLVYRPQQTAGPDKDEVARSPKPAAIMHALMLKNEEVNDQSQAALQAIADKVIDRS